MPLRSLAARAAILLALLLASAPARAAEFTDSAGRRVMLPDQITRIMPAGPASAVFVFVLVPDKLIGWPLPLSRAQRALMPAKYARLPVVGQLGGSYPTATADDVIRLHPDLIVGYGAISPPTVALADRIQQQTHTPYILLDDSIQLMPQMLRQMSPIFGAGDNGLAVASYAFHAIGALRGQLLITSPTDRPLVYYGRGPDGLETALPGSARGQRHRAGGRHQRRGRAGPGRADAGDARPDLRLEPADHHRAAAQLLQRAAAQPAMARAGGGAQQESLPGASRPVRLDRRSAGRQPRDRHATGSPSLFYPNLYQQDMRTVAREFYQLYYGVQLTDRPARGAGPPRRTQYRPVPTARQCSAPRRRAAADAEHPARRRDGNSARRTPGRGGQRGNAAPPLAQMPKLPGSP